MKKVFFIAAMAFVALFTTNSAKATTTVTENAETLTTRTETPMTILGEDMLKITITIHFKRFDLTIEIECMTAGGGGNNGGGTIEADGSVEGNMLKIQLPDTKNRDLAGATSYRIVKGGIFKLPNGEWLIVKEGQMLSPTAAGTLACPVQKHNKTGHVTLIK